VLGAVDADPQGDHTGNPDPWGQETVGVGFCRPCAGRGLHSCGQRRTAGIAIAGNGVDVQQAAPAKRVGSSPNSLSTPSRDATEPAQASHDPVGSRASSVASPGCHRDGVTTIDSINEQQEQSGGGHRWPSTRGPDFGERAAPGHCRRRGFCACDADASASECASLAAMTEHPASTHARTLALVALYRSGDHVGVAELLSELSGPEEAAVTIVSLIQFVSRLLDEAPEDGDVWLRDALVHLAQVEGEKSIE
jgi:hypothetical protein